MEYTIDIHGEINDTLVNEVVTELRGIYEWNLVMLETYVNPTEIYEKVELDIDTPGGIITGFMQIRKEVDKLKSLGVKVDTYVSGTAYSCGFLLCLLGENRYADELGSFLYHRGGCQLGYDKVDSNARFLEHQKDVLDKVDDFIIENTNIDKDLLVKYRDIDWYISFEEAIEMGVINKSEENKKDEMILTTSECVEILKQSGYKVIDDEELNEIGVDVE